MGEAKFSRRRVVDAAQEAITLANDCHAKISELGKDLNNDRRAVRDGFTAVHTSMRKVEEGLKRELADQTTVSDCVAGALHELRREFDDLKRDVRRLEAYKQAVDGLGFFGRIAYVCTGSLPSEVAQ